MIDFVRSKVAEEDALAAPKPGPASGKKAAPTPAPEKKAEPPKAKEEKAKAAASHPSPSRDLALARNAA